MKNFESHLKQVAVIRELEAKLPGLRDALMIAQADQVNLGQEAARAEALEEADWKDKAKAAKENDKKLWQLRDELETVTRTLAGLKANSEQGEALAIEDLRSVYGDRVKKLIGDLLSKYREAAEIEQQIIKVKDEAVQEGLKISAFPMYLTPEFDLELSERGPKSYWRLTTIEKRVEQLGVGIANEG